MKRERCSEKRYLLEKGGIYCVIYLIKKKDGGAIFDMLLAVKESESNIEGGGDIRGTYLRKLGRNIMVHDGADKRWDAAWRGRIGIGWEETGGYAGLLDSLSESKGDCDIEKLHTGL